MCSSQTQRGPVRRRKGKGEGARKASIREGPPSLYREGIGPERKTRNHRRKIWAERHRVTLGIAIGTQLRNDTQEKKGCLSP